MRAAWAVVALATACEPTPVTSPPCVDRSATTCTDTPGCRLAETFPRAEDPASGFTCWDDLQPADVCVPDLDADRCPVTWTSAAAAEGASCDLFPTACVPESWVPCETFPAPTFCPVCTAEPPPWRAPDAVVAGREGLGRAAALPGDVTGDGVPDLVVAAAFGGVLVLGPLGVDADRVDIDTTDGAGRADWWVLGPGDLTGDGLPDVVVGSPNHARSARSERTGAAFVLAGPLTDGSAAVRLQDAAAFIDGGQPGDDAGAWLAVGELDGMPGVELAVASPKALGDVDDGGRIDALATPLPTDAATWLGDRDDALRGRAGLGTLLTLADIDGDGIDDAVARTSDTTLTLVRGPLTGGASQRDDGVNWSLRAPLPPTGAVLVGDFDGDGDADLAWGDPTAGFGAGAVHVVAGPLPLTPAELTPTTLTARCGADGLGAALLAWDADGDGTDELVAGHGGVLPSAAGASLISAALATPSWERLGPGAVTHLSLGHADGDGKLDLAVGDPAGGQVRVFLGR